MLTNIHDANTNQTLAAILGPRIQQVNPYTTMAEGVVIEFLDAVELEEICSEESREQSRADERLNG